MNAKEAFDYVAKMRQRKAHEITVVQSTRDVETLKAGGWKLGIVAQQVSAKKATRTTWRNIAYFFNPETKMRVFYWENDGRSKKHAQQTAYSHPVPAGFEHFTTVSAVAQAEPPCPECEKMHAVKDKSQAIGEFLEWLQAERKVHLCVVHSHSDGCYEEDDEFHEDPPKCGCNEGDYLPFHKGTEQLLAEFFGIDLAKVEDEKRALLEFVRKGS